VRDEWNYRRVMRSAEIRSKPPRCAGEARLSRQALNGFSFRRSCPGGRVAPGDSVLQPVAGRGADHAASARRTAHTSRMALRPSLHLRLDSTRSNRRWLQAAFSSLLHTSRSPRCCSVRRVQRLLRHWRLPGLVPSPLRAVRRSVIIASGGAGYRSCPRRTKASL